MNTLREAFQQRIKYELEQRQKQLEERQRRYQHDLDRRLHPKTKDDFDVLYAALESKRRSNGGQHVLFSLKNGERKKQRKSMRRNRAQVHRSIFIRADFLMFSFPSISTKSGVGLTRGRRNRIISNHRSI